LRIGDLQYFWPVDKVLLCAERLARQFFWSFPRLRARVRRTKSRREVVSAECKVADIRAYLGLVGVGKSEVALVHSGIAGISLIDDDGQRITHPISVAQHLLGALLEQAGTRTTLAMPTNARYQTEQLEQEKNLRIIPLYDPKKTPSNTGLVSELFWRKKGTQRSLSPYNMLAVRGPLSEELLWNNLHDNLPFAHGLDSGYYRLCQKNALVISIGVPLKSSLTIMHVVEEIRAETSFKNFFQTKQYRVMHDGEEHTWTIRVLREEYAKFCCCTRKLGRDLTREQIIHEGYVGSVRVDWARAKDIYDYLWEKTKNDHYPYYATWMTRKN
jgi:aminoglycoside N3'-acetyltransferase